jgi:hypothetical protein
MRHTRTRTGISLLAGVAACACLLDTAAGSDPAGPPDDAARLLVVAPRALAAAMEPLVAAKNATNMPARLVVLETLPKDSGRDDAERVKRAIFDAHAQHGTRYVLLAGDASLFPVRFRKVTQIPADAYLDCTYNPTDHYYACLYKCHEPGADRADPAAIGHVPAFDDWDANKDGAFGEQHWKDDAVTFNPDRMDGCPDVAVGRLPVHTPEEAAAYVGKVLRYEAAGYSGKLNELALLADCNYAGSTGLCDLVAGDAPASRLLLNCPPEAEAPARWTKGTFRSVDFSVLCSGWIVYVGHAGARGWCVAEAGRNYDATRVARMQRGDPLRGAVFSVGCDSGRFMCWAPSEPYVDREGKAHALVWDDGAKQWSDAGKEVGPRLLVPPPGCYDLPDARDRTFACAWLAARGGAIVFAGESLVCQNDMGAELVRDVLARRTAGPQVLGDMWLAGQRRYWLDNRASEHVFRNPRIYLAIMTLFGDPSIRVPGRGETPK